MKRYSGAGVCMMGLVVLALLTGCVFDDSVSGWGGHQSSYDLKGERVQVQMLSIKQCQAMASEKGVDQALIDNYFPSNQSALAAAGAVALVDAGFKIIQAEIKKEIARYEQSYSAQTLAPDFWVSDGPAKVPAYAGIHLQRFTKKSGDKPAFEWFAAIKPVENGNFFIVYPLYAKLNTSKAKIISSSEKVKIEMDVVQNSIWIDKQGVLQNRDLAAIKWKGTLAFGVEEKYVDRPCGVLVGPPLGNTKTPPGGLMELKFTVTERDTTKAQEILKKVEEVVKEEGPKVVENIKKRLGEEAEDEGGTTASGPSIEEIQPK